ncbi:MAG: DUF3575 domain-containing protein [Acidobacteria bacterium]|nr:DUF3575 domain-containing protein [Acidobacteriota bacterium]
MIRVTACLALLCVLLSAPTTSSAQSAAGPTQSINGNPFGLLLGWFNAEYERKVNDSVAVVVGGSYWDADGDKEAYINGDVMVRYFPQQRALRGFYVGTKVGLTRTESARTRFGIGVDAGYQWTLGPDGRFFLATGFGLKRLFGATDQWYAPDVVPTFRIVNVGIAF